MIKEYYEKLYTTTKPNKELLENYIFETNLKRNINAEDFKICDGKLTIEECTSATNMMKLNKSRGLDGLTVEFYLTFWDKIKCFFEFFNFLKRRPSSIRKLSTNFTVKR